MSTDPSALCLDPGETVQWSDHPRLMGILRDAVLGVVLVAIGIGSLVAPNVLGTVVPAWVVRWSIVLVPVGIALPVWATLARTHTLFVISDRALYVERGVFGRRVDRLTLDRVQNSSYSQGIRGTLFGYGTVSIDMAGIETILRFHDIEDPRDVSARINQHTSPNDDIPGTVDQWKAVLSEVRALRSMLETRH